MYPKMIFKILSLTSEKKMKNKGLLLVSLSLLVVALQREFSTGSFSLQLSTARFRLEIKWMLASTQKKGRRLHVVPALVMMVYVSWVLLWVFMNLTVFLIKGWAK